MAQYPSQRLMRASISHRLSSNGARQVRYASLLRRPQRPYTFTQLVTLSDGSTYTQRTTSPQPVYKSTKDSRNHPLWQPSLRSLRDVEEDDAGRLQSFRRKFGRGWDIEASAESLASGAETEEGEGSLMDLISGYSVSDDTDIKQSEGTTKPKK